MHKNIRTQDAADYLGISKSLLDKLRCYSGGPSYTKLGRAVIYNTADLDAWLISYKVAPSELGGRTEDIPQDVLREVGILAMQYVAWLAQKPRDADAEQVLTQHIARAIMADRSSRRYGEPDYGHPHFRNEWRRGVPGHPDNDMGM
jgi:predicted DNA-binding transcriptional regulator AlpA